MTHVPPGVPTAPAGPVPLVRLLVDEAAVAGIAAAAARAVPGVVALHAGLSDTTQGVRSAPGRARQGVAVVVVDDAAEIGVTITTRLGDNCRDLAAAVQHAVRRAVVEQTSLAVRVQVTVAEVIVA